MKQGWHSLILFTLPLCAIGSLTFINTVRAQQVTPDGTVSTTVTTPDGKNFNINDGTRRGGNLFHSFKEFSVPTGGSANFNNATDVQNIIGRVTGGSVSNIDGAIRALGKANVFLLNPAGIIFGPNAQLNIGGSFLGTTAHSFLFDNGFEFSATNPQAPPLLTINVPIGLGFRDNPGEIKVQGLGDRPGYNVNEGPRPQLDSSDETLKGFQVEPGKTLALVGGNVFVERAILRARGGRIEIGSFDSNQVVNLVPAQSGFSLAYQGTPNFRDIKFYNQAFANVTNVTGDGNGSSSIAIIGRNIDVTSESILLADTLDDKNGGEIRIVGDSISFNSSSLLANTFGSGDGAQVKLDANNINFENGSGISIQTSDKGKAGDINIRANSLKIGGSSALASLTTEKSTGNAGDINVNVNGPMAVTKAGINTNSSGTGKAGTINIKANSLQIDTSRVTSSVENTGQAGEINFNVADSLASKGSTIITDTSGTGYAGKININANSFRLEEGIVSSQTQQNSTGKGGEINITVKGSLELPRAAGIETTTKSIDNAGNISIATDTLSVAGGANITANTSGKGNAGNIIINAREVSLAQISDTNDRSGVFSTVKNTGMGNGGEIRITTDKLSLTDGAQLSARSDGQGNAGDIKINAGSLSITNGAQVSVNSSNNNYTAGNITVTTAKDIRLDNKASIDANTSGGQGNISLNSRDLILRNSNITTNAQGTANGGNIEINNTGNLVVFEDSKITANAKEGSGGTVNITARGIFRSPNSITATSDAGPQFNGTVQFNTPETDPTQGLFELTETVTDPAQQIALNPCTKGFGSTFTITGRGGLPSDPNKILSSDNVRVDLVEPVPSKVSSTTATEKKPSQKPPVKRIIPAQGWIYNEKGQVVLVGYDPTKTGPQREQPAPTSNCAATR